VRWPVRCAVGSYLPWLSGTIDRHPVLQTGFQGGHGWAFTMGALALVCAALLAVRWRGLRLSAITLSVLLAGSRSATWFRGPRHRDHDEHLGDDRRRRRLRAMDHGRLRRRRAVASFRLGDKE